MKTSLPIKFVEKPEDGTLAAHYEYSPFGEIVVQSGDLASSFSHRFSTKPWCNVTGLSEHEFRKYSPSMGRWLSRDPAGESASIQLYCFVDNDPTSFVDTDGRIKFGKWILGVAWYTKWGFDFNVSVDDQPRDCCDEGGQLIKEGWQYVEAEGELQFGLGLGTEISIGTKKGGTRTISKLIKGPQVNITIKSVYESQYCGGPAVGKKACGRAGIDAGGGFSVGYLAVSASGESGIRGYVEGCLDAEDRTWDVKLCAGTYGHAVFALGIGPVSKPIWKKDWSVDPACVTIGSGSF